jgi:TrpR family transcriptional regulator, trp operon repressor
VTTKKPGSLPGAFLEIRDLGAMRRFFDEIFTSAEKETLALRWELMKRLAEGKSQRAIAAELGLSLCKITRGAKVVHDPVSVTNRILRRHRPRKEKRT